VGDFSNNVLKATDGNFYGVSFTGGLYGRGSFFKLDGSGVLTMPASFGDPDSDARGTRPLGQLVEAGNYFYGVTQSGGRFGAGTVFRINSTTAVIETLVDFSGYDGGAVTGGYPSNGLALGSDGNFYGFCSSTAHDSGGGQIYRVSPAGRFETVVEFTGRTGAAPGGYYMDAPLLPMSDGTFIGVTGSGGKANFGVIFRVSTAGVYTELAEFTGKDPGASASLPEGITRVTVPMIDGMNPGGRLVATSDGTVYGAYYTQQRNYILLWRLQPSGIPQAFVTLDLDKNGQSLGSNNNTGLAVLGTGDLVTFCFSVEAYSFNSGFVTISPAGVVTPLEDLGLIGNQTYGNFYTGYMDSVVSDGAGGIIQTYGTHLLKRPAGGPSALFGTTTPDGGTGEGNGPLDNVLVTSDGSIFGRFNRGGANDYGGIFKRDSTGTLAPVLSFTTLSYSSYYNGNDYYSPLNANPLTFETDNTGNILFANTTEGLYSVGAIQRITQAGVVSTIYDFNTSGIYSPSGGLTPDGLGNFYGEATKYDSVTFIYATSVYRLNTLGAVQEVASLAPLSKNSFSFSYGPLTLQTSTTLLGALPFGVSYEGLIFKVTSTGQLTKLVDFGRTPDEAQRPIGPFLKETSGSFLVASMDGGEGESGILLRVPVAGNPQPVVTFTGKDGAAPGSQPSAPLVRDASNRTYGMTLYGGASDLGVLYRVEADGTYTLLHQFHFDSSVTGIGGLPSTGLTLSGSYIYGGTFLGGPGGGGALFRFPLTPNGSATTSTVNTFDSNSATFEGTITSNGYGGTYWFTIEEVGGATVETDHLFLPGFSGSQNVAVAVDTLKGHRDYKVTLHTALGAGPGTVGYAGSEQTFHTPNGTPRPADDTIIVTQATGGTTGEVLANDLPDPDGDVLTIDPTGFTQPTYGTAAVGPDNTVIYTPTTDFFDPNIGKGRDSFTYTVKDDQVPALSKTAKVDVLSTISISGDYSGLLLDVDAPSFALLPGAEAITADQIAAGFASIALTKTRKFSARFQIGTRTVAVKGMMSEGRGTRVSQPRAGFDGELRPTPGGVEGRITINGRTLVLRMGQAFEAAQGVPREPSDFTMRFDPETVEDPVNAAGVPAGAGYAIVLERKKSRVKIVGVLPDGTAFSNGSLVGADKQLDFYTTIYKGKIGSVGGQLALDANNNIDGAAGTPVQWKKAANSKEKRFSAGFGTKMTAYGGKYTVPDKTHPPFPCEAGDVLDIKFDRGGLFEPLHTHVGFNVKKPVLNPDGVPDHDAKAKVKFNQRTGLVTGTFIPVKKPVAWKALIIDRDKTAKGFFLGTGDTGSVEIKIIP
jgi:uncharacterized repeat protein (TIGR03803 family)